MKLDVGTSRIGFLPVELPKLIYHLQKQPSLNIQGIFSHFAESEKADQSFTNKQNSLFCALVEKLEQQLGKIPLKHISCTAATLFNPASRHNMARIGIGLYGLWPTASNKRQYIELHPVLQWKTRVIAVKTLTAGATIGYERTYKVKRKMQIAVLPVGYADGLTRSLSSRGQVLLHGRKCTILGRISMNLCMIACNGMAVKSGDEVVLIGKQGREVQSAEDLAREMGTIHYEVVSHISPLLPRRVVK